ncbi:MAG: carboxypeptidase regulatory-like domain-containing protein [Mucilaginibacter sp.]
MIKNLLLFTFFLPVWVSAQYSIKGRVISQNDTKPVAYASVFLSNATIGDKTTADGNFTLQNIKPGKYELVVSIIGFETYNQTVTVNSDLILPDITIYPKSITLNEVKIIKPKTDFERQRNYDWFKEVFLGATAFAKDCNILNPEVLDLSYDDRTGVLTASSVDFLVVLNNALGYKIKYLLKEFTLNNADEQNKSFSYSGLVSFEELKGASAGQEHWTEKRQEAYEGSEMHFLRSAAARRIAEEGFQVLRVPTNPARPNELLITEKLRLFQALKKDKAFRDSLKYWEKMESLPKTLDKLVAIPLKTDDIITGPDKQGLYAISGQNDDLYITYNKYRHLNRIAMSQLDNAVNTDNTLLSFNSHKAFFDKNGTITNPQSLAYRGVWLRTGLAGLLPTDYEPQQSGLMPVDSNLVKKVNERLTAYSKAHETEKAYLHFDKPYYAAGDTMYFKAYAVQGDAHTPSHASKLLYVELMNDSHNVSKSIILELTNGVGWGDFALPDTLPAGNYRVRAYSQWMLADNQPFFDQTIPVGSTHNKRVAESGYVMAASSVTKPDVGFFPEGGSLISGVRSKIAFKAVGRNGLGVDVKGVVLDDENKEISTFASGHLGMGFFFLTPSGSKSYRAKIVYPDGSHDLIELPKSQPNGITLAVDNLASAFAVKVSADKEWYGQNRNKPCTLIIYSGNTPLCYTLKTQSGETTVTILKRDLHSGVARATLFSAEGEPLCERLFFVQNDDLLKITLSTNKNSNSPWEQHIDIAALTSTGEPDAAHFSVSVTDESLVQVNADTEPTIITNLLLTSDLKGIVEQPNYYFNNVSDKTAEDLDLVMLTHGFRRFGWKQVFDQNVKSPLTHQPERGLVISGQVSLHGKAVANGKVRLFTRSAGGFMLDTLTDANGRFVFDKLAFDNATKFVIQARTANGLKDVDIKIDSLISPPDVAINSQTDTSALNNNLKLYVQRSKSFFDERIKYQAGNHLLNEVIIKDKKMPEELKHSANLNGPGNADQVITSKWLETSGYTNLYDALRAKLTGVEFTPNHYVISKRANPSIAVENMGYRDRVALILDGMFFEQREQGQPNILTELDVDQIESIEYLEVHYAAIYGSRAAGGALVITTKRAKKINNYYKEAPGVVVYSAKGFYKAREFYTPKYDADQLNINRKDLRTTIYWNPEIATGKDGHASIGYSNAGRKATYRVVIEGIDDDGNLGRQVYRYKVE